MITTISCRCPLCGTITQVTCEENAWQKYVNGALAQEAFSDMDAYTRETIISGMCLKCQESFFEEEEDGCDGECDACADFDCPSNISFLVSQEE